MYFLLTRFLDMSSMGNREPGFPLLSLYRRVFEKRDGRKEPISAARKRHISRDMLSVIPEKMAAN
jgi:hypothetical protein